MSIHSFLLIGQSNMAGRGVIGSVPPIENPRLLVARNGRWQPLFVPVNPDRPFSGICLGESFADAYSRDFSQDTGLIPCADGGTSLDQWKPGSLLYDHAVAMAKLAQRTSTLAGILWHQGETDCTPQDSPLYGEKLLEMLRCLRRDLDAPQVPILLGGLGDFLSGYSQEVGAYAPVINRALEQVADTLPQAAFVSAKGLTSKPDSLHFDAPALREFGLRYYWKLRELDLSFLCIREKAQEDGRAHTHLEQL